MTEKTSFDRVPKRLRIDRSRPWFCIAAGNQENL